MDKQQIITALVGKYQASYTVYELLEQLNKKAIHDGDTTAHRVFSRQASLESSFLDGLKAAAEALGVSTAELIAVVNSVEEAAER